MIKILMGKSASGKDYYLKQFLSQEENRGYQRVVTYTTRPKRTNEVNGIDYNFIDKEEFITLLELGYIIEYRKYKTNKGIWYYGTPALDEDENYIMIADFTGAKKLIEAYGIRNVTLYYVVASDETRIKRAMSRGSYDEVEWNRRYLADNNDFTIEKMARLGVGVNFIYND